LGDKKLPFLAEFDCCHTHPMITLPIGAEIELDATNKKVTIINESLDNKLKDPSILTQIVK
jgi:muramoyltetrapeptide carboxypeptidase LdcA involved in peptidoglycan recycling